MLLGDVAVLLEGGHVVADRRGGHAQLVPVKEHLGTHWLLQGDVVRHDGAQHLAAALLVRQRLAILRQANSHGKTHHRLYCISLIRGERLGSLHDLSMASSRSVTMPSTR